MAVEVSTNNILSGSGASVSRFTDSLKVGPTNPRNIIGPPTNNWIWAPLSGDTPTAGAFIPGFNFGAVIPAPGNLGCAINPVSYAGTTYSFCGGIIPAVAYVGSPIYNAKTKFVQVAFNTIANGVVGIGYGNYEDVSGTGIGGSSNINHDAYVVQWGAASYSLQRYNSGAGTVSLQAVGAALVGGDVIRMSMDTTVPGQTTIIVLKNGVAPVPTTVDNNALRLSGGAFPFICFVNFAAGFAGTVFNFDCGVGL
jgi:hypothetical protein